MTCAKRFGVDPGTVQRISRPFDGVGAARRRGCKYVAALAKMCPCIARPCTLT